MRALLSRKRQSSLKVGRLLGERLRRRRVALGLDLAALKSTTGARAGALAAAEQGHGDDLPAGLLFDLARALDVSIDYFFEDAPALKAERSGVADAEVRSFVAAYWAIRDARARRSILALARAAAEEGPPA